jgi:hypothetical protein
MQESTHLLHRQVNPSWIQQGRFTSQTFLPTSKDAGLLSVYDGQQMDAQQSYVHYTASLSLKSVGVVSVDSGQVSEVGLSWRPDPTPFPEHAVIDFSSLVSSSQMKAKAAALAEKARNRGWTHQP